MIKLWLLAARPKTLWAAISPVMIGTAFAVNDGGFHALSAFLALFGAVMIQIGTNFANDYHDYKKGADTKERKGPVRVTQAGLIKPETVKKAYLVVFLLALLSGIYLIYRGGIPILTIGLFSILFGILYTAGPFPLGYHGLGEIFVLVFFGPVAVGGAYYVQALDITNSVLIVGLAPGLISTAILTVNNLRDIDTDKKTGKMTLAVRFGAKFARIEYLLTMVSALLIPSVVYLITRENLYTVISSAVLLAAFPVIREVFTENDGEKLNNVLAKTGKLLLLFSIVFSITLQF
ncbi:MAG: 1,4-dihydroxy-2-naphthoate polyprenyltransferase [bacterium]|nr:1,4-dihydroxy-2-naphthoate polyprenyltransferase [bacterium]